MNNLFRSLPSVDACLSGLENAASVLYATTPRPLLRSLTNAFLDGCRRDIKEGRLTDSGQLGLDALLPRLAAFAEKEAAPRFRRVLNATGVVIHTNMGRSVLADEAVNAILKACRGYSNLELNLATGERGSRYSHVEELLCTLTGAEAALVVNNNAAAVLITMDALCSGGEVVVARGQLVEIGGSFRIPDVMERSGATLREVGCTNRVHPQDYENAINERTVALMRVHTSNYRIVGFHADVPVEELADMAHRHGLPLIEDLGSGSFLDFTAAGLPGEPTVRFGGFRLFDFGAGVLPLFRHKFIDFVKGHNHIAGLRYGRPGLFLLGLRRCGLFGCNDRLGGLRGNILRRASIQFFIGHLRSSFSLKLHKLER